MGRRHSTASWSDAEVETLELLYPRKGAAAVAERLGRPIEGVYRKAARLGLVAPADTRPRRGTAYPVCPACGLRKRPHCAGLCRRCHRADVQRRRSMALPARTPASGLVLDTSRLPPPPPSYPPAEERRRSRARQLSLAVADAPLSLYELRAAGWLPEAVASVLRESAEWLEERRGLVSLTEEGRTTLRVGADAYGRLPSEKPREAAREKKVVGTGGVFKLSRKGW